MTHSTLQVQESKTGEVCVVSLAGRIDSTNAEELATHLNRLLECGEKNVLVDMKQVLYLTSAAFRALLIARRAAQRAAARFGLCGVGGQVRELFEIGGLMDAFTIHATCDEALQQMG